MVEETLRRLNLGCGRDIKEGWINLDLCDDVGVDVVHDLEMISPLPFDESSIDEIYASHVIEHVRNFLALGEELHRIAKPGARMVVRVPYGSSDDAFEDPTHVRQCFLGTFGYWSQHAYWKADYGYRGDWKIIVSQLVLSKAHEGLGADVLQHAIMHDRNVVNEMVVVMECVKPARKAERNKEQHRVELVFA